MDLNQFLWGNSIRAWLVGLGVATCLFFALLLIRRQVSRWTAARVQDQQLSVRLVVSGLVRTASPMLFLASAVFVGNLFIPIQPPEIHVGLSIFLRLSVFYQIGLVGQAIINLLVRSTEGKVQDRVSSTAMIGFALLGKVTLWIVLVLVSLENMGVNMTTLIASLGVGGIAVGLAMQRVVADLIASLAIVLDRPFTQGDFITLDTISGTVERIGLKTTRIRGLTGEELVVPNTDLIQGRIQNFRTLQERRIVFGFGVTYDTSADLLERIPDMVREIVGSVPDLRFDRAHFKSFGSSSLDFEVVYYVVSPDYLTYMNAQQAINLSLIRRFAAFGLEFALPSQTVYLEQSLSQPAAGSSSRSDTPSATTGSP